MSLVSAGQHFFPILLLTTLPWPIIFIPPCFSSRFGSFKDSREEITHYAYVSNAVESGVKEADDLFDSIEPQLYKNGMFTAIL